MKMKIPLTNYPTLPGIPARVAFFLKTGIVGRKGLTIRNNTGIAGDTLVRCFCLGRVGESYGYSFCYHFLKSAEGPYIR